MDAHYGKEPKHKAAVEAVPPCWTTWSVGLRPPHKAAALTRCSRIVTEVSPQQHMRQGGCGAVVEPLSVSATMCRSAQSPPIPPSSLTLGEHTGEVCLSVNRVGRLCLFSSSRSYSISALHGLGISAAHEEINNVLGIYHLFLKTLQPVVLPCPFTYSVTARTWLSFAALLLITT